MHKIIIDKIINSDIDYIRNNNEISFNIYDNLDLLIDINFNSNDYIININVLNNISTNIIIISKGLNGSIKYNYIVGLNSIVNIEKINIVDSINEEINDNIYENSTFNYIFKSITLNKENYNYQIYHDDINSNSNIINNCINDSGSINLEISSYIPKNIIGCCANQYNKIINNTENICEIKPNLYIDCSDVEANHSALIDKFSNNDIFYLQTKGINYKDCIKLLTKGFLLSKINNQEIKDIINKRYGGE